MKGYWFWITIFSICLGLSHHPSPFSQQLSDMDSPPNLHHSHRSPKLGWELISESHSEPGFSPEALESSNLSVSRN